MEPDTEAIMVPIEPDTLHALIVILRDKRALHDEALERDKRALHDEALEHLPMGPRERRSWANSRDDLDTLIDACLGALRAHLRKGRAR